MKKTIKAFIISTRLCKKESLFIQFTKAELMHQKFIETVKKVGKQANIVKQQKEGITKGTEEKIKSGELPCNDSKSTQGILCPCHDRYTFVASNHWFLTFQRQS